MIQQQVKVAGALILVATVTYIVGSALVDAVLTAPDVLAAVAGNPLQVVLGVLSGHICAFAVVGVAVFLYPLLAHYNPVQAVSYTAARVLESVLLLVSGGHALVLVQLSQDTALESAGFPAVAAMLVAGNGLSYQVAMLALGIGSVPFCTLLLTRRLIPRWLAVAGIVGYVALAASAVIAILGYETLSIYLYAPGAIFEIVFPLWLIVRGIDGSTSGTPTADPVSLAGATPDGAA